MIMHNSGIQTDVKIYLSFRAGKQYDSCLLFILLNVNEIENILKEWYES
jgi:hypothetical protein